MRVFQSTSIGRADFRKLYPISGYGSCPRHRSIRCAPRSSRLAAIHDRNDQSFIKELCPTRPRHDSRAMTGTATLSAFRTMKTLLEVFPKYQWLKDSHHVDLNVRSARNRSYQPNRP